MVKIALKYEGDLRVHARHEPSGTTLKTDAPVDNQGRGESFSPTDLLATGLGSCMATIMGIVARREQIPIEGMEVQVEKIMSSDAPRRVIALNVDIASSAKPEPEQIQSLEKAAHTCPVAQSIHPDIKVTTRFRWGA